VCAWCPCQPVGLASTQAQLQGTQPKQLFIGRPVGFASAVAVPGHPAQAAWPHPASSHRPGLQASGLLLCTRPEQPSAAFLPSVPWSLPSVAGHPSRAASCCINLQPHGVHQSSSLSTSSLSLVPPRAHGHVQALTREAAAAGSCRQRQRSTLTTHHRYGVRHVAVLGIPTHPTDRRPVQGAYQRARGQRDVQGAQGAGGWRRLCRRTGWPQSPHPCCSSPSWRSWPIWRGQAPARAGPCLSKSSVTAGRGRQLQGCSAAGTWRTQRGRCSGRAESGVGGRSARAGCGCPTRGVQQRVGREAIPPWGSSWHRKGAGARRGSSRQRRCCSFSSRCALGDLP